MSLRLTDAQRIQVEQYLPLVTRVMVDCVHGPTGIYDWNDLVQYGRIGLCKAAATYEEGRNAVFETYAYVLIRNEIYDALGYATRRKQRESAYEDMDTMPMDDLPEAEPGGNLAELLDAAAGSASGVTAKGIEALRLYAQGYSCKEIGHLFGGVSDNNVSAWMSRARKYLRQEPTIAAFAP